MGSGEYSGNGSVYWKVGHGNSNDLKVKLNNSNRPKPNDPDPADVHCKRFAQGRDAATVDRFRVTLRFEPSFDPVGQLEAALNTARSATGSFFVTFNVPATVSGVPRTDPDQQPAPDVSVKWGSEAAQIP